MSALLHTRTVRAGGTLTSSDPGASRQTCSTAGRWQRCQRSRHPQPAPASCPCWQWGSRMLEGNRVAGRSTSVMGSYHGLQAVTCGVRKHSQPASGPRRRRRRHRWRQQQGWKSALPALRSRRAPLEEVVFVSGTHVAGKCEREGIYLATLAWSLMKIGRERRSDHHFMCQ